ncbi:MAG: hypothetical protein WC831_03805 [Parcubacteria group bacterium]|jgi:hypothetical protein
MEEKQKGQSGQKPAEQTPAGQQPQKSSSSNVIVIVIVVIVVFGIVALAGGYFVVRSFKAKVSQKIGENVMEKMIEKGTGQKADVSSDGKSVSVETDSGTFSASDEGTIKLPSDFPSDVFVYGDAKITFATSTVANPADGTKASYMIGYMVNQSVSDAVNKYRKEMAKNGWIKETEADYGAMMISFKKGDREALVTISENQDGQKGTTGVSLSVSEN